MAKPDKSEVYSAAANLLAAVCIYAGIEDEDRVSIVRNQVFADANYLVEVADILKEAQA